MPHDNAKTPAPPWLAALVDSAERHTNPPSALDWIPYARRMDHAMSEFQGFADYFLAATAAFARPRAAEYRVRAWDRAPLATQYHVVAIRIPHLHQELHGWVDIGDNGPDACPVLQLELGNRRTTTPAQIRVLWRHMVCDAETPVDFTPAVSAWTHWLADQPAPPTPQALRAARGDRIELLVATIMLTFLVILSVLFHPKP